MIVKYLNEGGAIRGYWRCPRCSTDTEFMMSKTATGAAKFEIEHAFKGEKDLRAIFDVAGLDMGGEVVCDIEIHAEHLTSESGAKARGKVPWIEVEAMSVLNLLDKETFPAEIRLEDISPHQACGKCRLILQPMVWDCLDYRREREDGGYDYLNEVVATCHNPASEVIVLRIREWPIIGYFQLPTSAPAQEGSGESAAVKWTGDLLQSFIRRFLSRSKNVSRGGKSFHTPRPGEVKLVWKKRIYGYRGDARFPYLKVKFATKANLRSFAEALTAAPVPLDGRLYVFKQAEERIPHIWRLLAKVGLRYTQWFRVANYQAPRDPISEELEYVCSWRDLKPAPPEETLNYQTHPMVLSFDIETFSSNERAMPDPDHILDETTMISAIYRRDGEPFDKAKRIDYVNGDCYPIPGAEVKRYPSEKAMYTGFFTDIGKMDPSIVDGYNTFKYDFDFLNRRFKRINFAWPYIGRFTGLERNQAEQWRNNDWASRSGGKHVNRYMEMDGRVVLDMLLHAKQNILPKLATWSLKEVAKAKLGKTKREEDHVQSFRDREAFCRAHDDLLGLVEEAVGRSAAHGCGATSSGSAADEGAARKLASRELRRLRAIADEAYAAEVPRGIPNGMPAKAQVELAPKTEAAFCRAVADVAEAAGLSRERATAVASRYHRAKILVTGEGEYNLVDSELVDELFAKLLVWPSDVQFSFVMGVSMTELLTKGQQLKCISQIFLVAHQEGFLITTREKCRIKFAGGLVQDPKIGIWKRLLTFDFSGMYPSIIISHNPSPDTLVVADCPVSADKVTERRFSGADLGGDDSEEEEDESKSRAYRENAKKEKKNRRSSKKKSKKAKGAEVAAKEPAQELVVRFVKSNVWEGLLPRVARRLVKDRAAVKALMEQHKKGSFMYELYNAQQNAIKVVANSLFGFTGVDEGWLPCVEVAMFITGFGQEMITGVKRYLEINYGGVICYGDTDSVMVTIPGIDGTNMKVRGPDLAKEITMKLFGDYPAIKLEYEKGFTVMIIFTKKKYAALLLGAEPTPENMFVRGIVLARHDNCLWVQKFYRALLFHILQGGGVMEALRMVFDYARRLFGGDSRAPIEDLVMIREYGGPYKGNYFLGTFANKLQRRGKQLTSGDRLEYLVTVTEEEERGGKAKSGEKLELMEDYQQAIADGHPMKVDYAYYLEHVARTPINQLFSIAYNDDAEALQRLEIQSSRRKAKSALTPISMILMELRSMGPKATSEEVVSRLRELEDWILSEL